MFFQVCDYILILNDFIISIVLRERTKRLSLNFLINIYLLFSTTFTRNLLVEFLYQIRRIFKLFCKQSLIVSIFSIESFNFISNILLSFILFKISLIFHCFSLSIKFEIVTIFFSSEYFCSIKYRFDINFKSLEISNV